MRVRRLVLLDVLAAAGFTIAPQVTYAHPGGVSAALWGLSAAAALPLCARWIWPLGVFGCVIVVCCVALPFGLAPTSLLAVAYASYPVAVSQPRPPRRSAAIIGGASAVVAAGLTLAGARNYHGGTEVTQILLGIVALGATWAVGTSVREHRAGVQRAIEQAAERGRIEERLRLARDFHDIATHSIGLIAVKAGVANHLLSSHPEEARDALQVIERVSRTALRDMRTVLRVLRPEGEGGEARPAGPGLADVPALIDEARAADVDARLETRFADPPPQVVAVSAYRIVQEALTNVIKHAAPTRCQVTITADAGVMEIVVSDDGPKEGGRARDASDGTGLGDGTGLDGAALGGAGLIGMRERAAAHDGTLTAAPRLAGGFLVTATLRY
jgi:signal transduction histidine kinase